ncbi:LysR substrate-binding domain-containing protein [Sneathiella glossodoripedis]|uniref:LysR substrate-binding domain-containing protein n=1 Tax=Sneathiella glossodoripedis TaxID=418853 RepID=UPI0004702995|nr:LysR substrate-binding domain-containing protein [Sneathiella glossodoripedis]
MPAPSKLPPLNALKVFEIVARTLNFRLAAEELGVSHGAVAQQIKLLEDHLELKLFNRLPRGLSLTVNGEQYFPEVHQALEKIRVATAGLNPQSNRICLSMPPSFANKYFMSKLSRLKESHPEYEVQILATETLADFFDDEVDIAIRLTATPFPDHLYAERFCVDKLIPVCTPEYGRRNLGNPPVLDPNTLTFLYDAHDHWPEYFKILTGNQEFHPRNSLKFNQTALAIDAAINGQGIALVSEVLVLEELKTGRLIQPFDEFMFGYNAYYLVHLRKRQSDKAIQLIMSWLRHETPMIKNY